MSRHHSHISSAVKIIETAVVGEPLAHHLKKFFAADKKFGSKDRKAIASLCYGYYRIGHAFPEKSTAEKIIAAIFLYAHQKNDLLAFAAPELNENAHWPLQKKMALLQLTYADIFPFTNELSEEIDKEKFALSFTEQPSVFLRIRPAKSVKTLEKLTEAKIAFEEISLSCIALQPGTKLDGVIKLNKDAVVQDKNSQHVFDYLQRDGVFLPKDAEVWDCCAASGGKSILLHDMLHGHVRLHVSDVRENILHNLKNRFADAGIKNYSSFIADLESDTPLSEKNTTSLFVMRHARVVVPGHEHLSSCLFLKRNKLKNTQPNKKR